MDLVTFTDKILNGKFTFCAVSCLKYSLHAIKSPDVILYGPGDLPLLNFFKAFSISDGVVGGMGED